MSIGMSVRISAISALLFAALLDTPAVARNYATRTFGPERFGSELQPRTYHALTLQSSAPLLSLRNHPRSLRLCIHRLNPRPIAFFHHSPP